uniref:Uncharacterized protein n=1 Tax=Odontella aurita TaxID=265563 RepID=A0A7S4IKP5_9STRA
MPSAVAERIAATGPFDVEYGRPRCWFEGLVATLLGLGLFLGATAPALSSIPVCVRAREASGSGEPPKISSVSMDVRCRRRGRPDVDADPSSRVLPVPTLLLGDGSDKVLPSLRACSVLTINGGRIWHFVFDGLPIPVVTLGIS